MHARARERWREDDGKEMRRKMLKKNVEGKKYFALAHACMCAQESG